MRSSLKEIASLVLVLTAAPLTGCSSAPAKPEHIARGEYETTKQYIAKLIQYEMKKNGVTGLSIALVDDQQIVWTQGFGYADKANNIAAAPDTVYRVGSISKLFTATAAMQLTEQGKLDIDRPLQTYLPEFSIKTRFPDAGPITPRGIMTHHSGLPGDLLNGMFTENPEPFTRVVSRLKDEYAAYPPNFILAYSNLGVTLLGHAIQQISGSDYSSHLHQSMLQPLGMVNSSFSVRAEGPLMSKAYRDGVETKEAPLRDVPAGGLNSNVLDMSRFMQMVFANGRSNGRRIVQPETLAEMLRPQNGEVALDQDSRVGLGWFLGSNKSAGLVAQHAGGTLFHRSQLIVLPEHKLGIVVLANSASAGQVVNAVAAATLRFALEAKTGIQPPERPRLAQNHSAPKALDLDVYAGYYATVFGFAKISNGGDRLFAEITGKRVELIPYDEKHARMQYRLFGIFPVPVENLENTLLSRANVSGREIVIANVGDRRTLVGEKITPVRLSEKWMKRVGDYEILNGGGDAFLPKKISLRHREGFLITEFDGVMGPAISPVSDTEAVTLGLGRGMQETIRVVTVDGEERVAYSGYLLRKKQAS